MAKQAIGIGTTANDGTGDFAGVAVTLWLVVFNEPGECAGADLTPPEPCGEDDIFNNDAAMADVLYGGGRVIGGSEKANIGYSLQAGDNSSSLFGEESHGLIDPRKAEVHYVLRSHGPLGDVPTSEMIHTFIGGCSDEDANHPPLPGFDPPADENDLHTEAGDCQDIQYAINLAP